MKKNKAFTLVELLFSCAIVGICLFSLVYSFIMCYALSEGTKNTTIAIEDARRVIEQMHSLSTDSLTLVYNRDWTAWGAANGCDSLPSEQVLVTYVDRDSSGDALDDDPLEVSVNITWQERQRSRIINFSVLLTPR